MERLFDVIQDRRGNAIQSATVTVRDSAGSLATIFTDDGSTTASNPLTTNADGEYTFFAANGQYSVEVVASGYATEIITQRTLFDPSDQTARALADYGYMPVREIATAAYTITAGNFGEWLDVNFATTAVISLPDQTAVSAWSTSESKGASVLFRQKGAGQVVLAAAGSATAVNASSLKTRARYSVLAAQAVATSTWSVYGDME